MSESFDMVGRLLGSLGLLAALSVIAGCDPAMVGASGSIRANQEVDARAYASLFVRVEPEGPEEPRCPGGCVQRFPVPQSFPFRYAVAGGGIGTSRVRTWRATAWLSNRESALKPEGGEPVGSSRFEAGKCFLVRGEYCGQTDNVDLTIGRP